MPKRTSSYRSWQLQKLSDPNLAASYLKAAMADSPAMFLKAVGNVAQAHQMANIARRSGVARENLYRAFSEEGNPTWSTVVSVLDAIGITLTPAPKKPGTKVEAERKSPRIRRR